MEVFKKNKHFLKRPLSLITLVCCLISSFSTFANQYRIDVLEELSTFDSTNIVSFILVPSVISINGWQSTLLKNLPIKNQVQLFTRHKVLPSLFDLTNKQFLALKAVKKLPTTTENSPNDDNQNNITEDSNTNAYGTLLLTLFFIVMAAIFYRLRPRNQSTKAQLKKQLARFELNETKNTLYFYKRHQTKINSQLAISHIVKSEIFLNNASLNIINKNINSGFNLQKESKLRVNFTSEYRNKLVDNEIRQVHLYLTDNEGKIHIICLYLRTGNQRFTRTAFFDILDNLVDWCWFIAKNLNPKSTEKRKIKVLVAQPSTKVPSIAQNKITPKASELDTKADKEITEKAEKDSELHNIAVHDTELINSLDKLANLKQKGFLSEEEFSLAKAKILLDITRNK